MSFVSAVFFAPNSQFEVHHSSAQIQSRLNSLEKNTPLHNVQLSFGIQGSDNTNGIFHTQSQMSAEKLSQMLQCCNGSSVVKAKQCWDKATQERKPNSYRDMLFYRSEY